jgi:hypothetical protein
MWNWGTSCDYASTIEYSVIYGSNSIRIEKWSIGRCDAYTSESPV